MIRVASHLPSVRRQRWTNRPVPVQVVVPCLALTFLLEYIDNTVRSMYTVSVTVPAVVASPACADPAGNAVVRATATTVAADRSTNARIGATDELSQRPVRGPSTSIV